MKRRGLPGSERFTRLPDGSRISISRSGDAELLVVSIPIKSRAAPDRPLTLAEVAVLEGLLEGKSNAAIANDRGTSLRTVASQVKSVFQKFGVGSRGELASYLAASRR